MKVQVNFVSQTPSDDDKAAALHHIADKISEGYSSGIGQPENVVSWRMMA